MFPVADHRSASPGLSHAPAWLHACTDGGCPPLRIDANHHRQVASICRVPSLLNTNAAASESQTPATTQCRLVLSRTSRSSSGNSLCETFFALLTPTCVDVRTDI